MYRNKEGAVIPTGAARSAEEWRNLVFLKWETKGGSTPALRAFARHDTLTWGTSFREAL